MSPESYLDFDLLIESDGPNYKATVIDSPAGQSDNSFTLPFSEKDLEILVLQVFRLTSRRSVRAIASPEMRDVRSFGGHLFESLFSGPVSTCLLRSMDEADRNQSGLRVRLHLGDAPSLANVPWEFLYDSSSDGFLCLSDQTPVVRFIDLPQRVEPLAASPPLRMLCLISSPAGYPPLDVEHEWAKLSEALGPTVREGRLVLERVDTPSLEALQRKLRRDDYHVLHFVGHGAFDEQAQDGVLLFEDLEGKGHPVSGESLGVLLHDHESLRLVVLNACEGARTSSTDPFAGTAQSLVRKGIPAVIAMQFEISDVAAITLANEFYSAVADGYPVDAALSEARKAIFTRVNAVEWATPVLYMRSPDGRIFEIEDQAERQEARSLRHEEPLAPVPTPESGPVAVAEPLAPAPETQPVAAERLTHPVPPPTRVEPVAPDRRGRLQPPTKPGGGAGPWTQRRVIIPVAIGAALLLLIGIGALLNSGGPGPASPSATDGSPSTAPTSAPPSILSRISFAPVLDRDIERSDSGNVLRAVSGAGGIGAVGVDGSRGAVWLSTDGITWRRSTMSPAPGGGTQQVQGITQFDSSLVAVGWQKTAGHPQSAAVWVSTDGGSTWNPAPDQPDFHGTGDTLMNRVTILRGVPVAVGRSGSDGRLWPSDDAVTWGRATNPVFDASPGHSLALRDAVEGNGTLVAVGEDDSGETGRAAAWFYDDASRSWDRSNVKGGRGDASIVSVIGVDGGFVAVGYDSPNGDRDAAVWISSDGRTWNRVPTAAALGKKGMQVMRGVVFIPGQGFLAVGVDDKDAAVWVSTDGRVWSRSERALGRGTNRAMTGIARTDTLIVIAGQEQGRATIWTAEVPG
jgi:hypothetical protein